MLSEFWRGTVWRDVRTRTRRAIRGRDDRLGDRISVRERGRKRKEQSHGESFGRGGHV